MAMDSELARIVAICCERNKRQMEELNTPPAAEVEPLDPPKVKKRLLGKRSKDNG